jgi:hypothetical protein
MLALAFLEQRTPAYFAWDDTPQGKQETPKHLFSPSFHLLGTEVVVNAQLAGISESALGFVVAVAKVMTVAGRLERISKRVIRRRRAAVG